MISKVQMIIAFFAFYSIGVNGFSCIQCNSSMELNCAVNPKFLRGKECPEFSKQQCFVRIIDGVTIRGCVNGDASINDTNSELCDSEVCNVNIFPKNRLRCQRCSSEKDAQCYSGNMRNSSSYCPIFRLEDACIIHKTNTSIERDCLSTAQASGKCKEPEQCYRCYEEDCNSLNGSNETIPWNPENKTQTNFNLTLFIIAILITILVVLSPCYAFYKKTKTPYTPTNKEEI